MPQQGPLHWLDGEGWLVLSGGGDPQRGETDAVDARLLSIANLDRPMLVLLAEGSRRDADRVLEHYTALGGPGGVGLSLAEMTRAQLGLPEMLEFLSEIGILYLGGVNPLPLVRNLTGTAALECIVRGYGTLQGLSIIGAGAGAAALGGWAVGPAPDFPTIQGLNFVPHTAIVPQFTRTEDYPFLPQLDALGLGIPEGTALAFGPQGQVETWGTGQVTAVVKAGDAAGEG